MEIPEDRRDEVPERGDIVAQHLPVRLGRSARQPLVDTLNARGLDRIEQVISEHVALGWRDQVLENGLVDRAPDQLIRGVVFLDRAPDGHRFLRIRNQLESVLNLPKSSAGLREPASRWTGIARIQIATRELETEDASIPRHVALRERFDAFDDAAACEGERGLGHR